MNPPIVLGASASGLFGPIRSRLEALRGGGVTAPELIQNIDDAAGAGIDRQTSDFVLDGIRQRSFSATMPSLPGAGANERTLACPRRSRVSGHRYCSFSEIVVCVVAHVQFTRVVGGDTPIGFGGGEIPGASGRATRNTSTVHPPRFNPGSAPSANKIQTPPQWGLVGSRHFAESYSRFSETLEAVRLAERHRSVALLRRGPLPAWLVRAVFLFS